LISVVLARASACFCFCLTDKTIKFWEWAVTTEQQQQQPGGGDDEPTAHPAKKQKKKHKQQDADGDDTAAAAAAGPVVQRLGFQLTRQLEMAEDVLCVKVCFLWVRSVFCQLTFLLVVVDDVTRGKVQPCNVCMSACMLCVDAGVPFDSPQKRTNCTPPSFCLLLWLSATCTRVRH
jgi:hypothetical protein